MRRVAVATLILALLLISLPAPARTEGRRAMLATGCDVTFTPARGSAVRMAIPLLVVLEWDSRGTPACMLWQATMQRASVSLENATGGQAALGPITLLDNAQDWDKADIQVHVQNTGIPDATVGGLAPATVKALGGTPPAGPLSPTSTASSGGVFMPGAIHLGRNWSEFGPRRGRWSDPDGFTTVLHELGHYAFYLYDEYYGYASAARTPASCDAQLFNPGVDVTTPIAPDQPKGASLMYWEYTLHQFWSGVPLDGGPGGCTSGRQWQIYGRPDWQVIAAHYPLATASGGSSTPAPPACAACGSPGVARWLLNYLPERVALESGAGVSALCTQSADSKDGYSVPCLQADGYLVKAGDRAVLHEGVPYLSVPAGEDTIPGATGDPAINSSFYPRYMLEMLGAAAGDVARVTLTDPRDASGVMQTTQVLAGPGGSSTPAPLLPAWYEEPLPQVPLIAAQPLVSSGGKIAAPAVLGLRLTASNPLGTPFTVAREQGQIGATLFEAGQGRQAAATLGLSTPYAAGHEQYAGTLSFAGGAPILDGSLYLTPTSSEKGHEDPGKPGGGAWALATYSLGCNSPTLFAGEHAPGDEGGIDSGDGVVNVHLPSASDIPGFCVGFTGQVTPPVAGGVTLSQTYAILGSAPLPIGTVITLHLDRDALTGIGGATVALVRLPPPGSRSVTGGPAVPCQLSTGVSTDLTDGTLSGALTAPSAGNAAFQATLLPPAVAEQLPKC
jgi:hypothetical protein